MFQQKNPDNLPPPVDLNNAKNIFANSTECTAQFLKQKDFIAFQLLITQRTEYQRLIREKGDATIGKEGMCEFLEDINTSENEFNGIMTQLITSIENNRKRFK